MIKTPLIAKLHVSEFKRKCYNIVTTISPKNHYLIKNIQLNKVTRSYYMFCRKFKRPTAEKDFFCRKGDNEG